LTRQRRLLTLTSPPFTEFPSVLSNEDYILEILVEMAYVSNRQIDQARGAVEPGASVLQQLIADESVSQRDVSQALAAHSNMEFMEVAQLQIPGHVLESMPPDLARRFHAIPVAMNDAALVVAISDPLDFETLDSLRFLLKREVETVCAPPDQIQQALVKYYGTTDDLAGLEGDDVEGSDMQIEGGEEDADQDTGDAPIIKMVSMLLLEAYKARASDIHLEPLESKFRVRFRIDGVLQEMQSPPKKLQAAIVSRLKIMTGSMSIAEKRLPQDGRIQVKLGKKAIDLRVSTIPTNHGESVVMRILDKSSLVLGLPQLGFLSDDQEVFEQLITLPDGILLVTGPTGSGKTTTLYACLNYVNKPDRKIITVEDPVEYQLNGINQVQVNSEIGMTFPGALRSMLRQAPNIIMIGEIRDLETAAIAINASLTGHLVFSTLHTNDAPSAVARLVDIGIKPFLVASSIRAIMAQRLVRKLCDNCKHPKELDEVQLRALNIDPAQLTESNSCEPVGCDVCRHNGYKGRIGLFEIFQIDDEVRHMINERLSTLQLRKRARELGMRTLREDGIRKVLAGITSAEEVSSVTMADAD